MASPRALDDEPAAGRGRRPEVPERPPHIRVAVRVRPVPSSVDSIIEVAGQGAIAVRKEAATGGNEFLSSQRGRTEERVFDRVFGPDATQAEVYTWCCKPLVVEALREGRNATVLVYGATGAGKTHTMFGERDIDGQGLIYRAICEVFLILAEPQRAAPGWGRLEVKLSFMDIYNETVRDLLQEGNVLCKVLEDERRNVVKVTGLREVVVANADEALKQLRSGMQARKVEATAANARSSRSHAVFSFTVERVMPGGVGPGNPAFQRRAPEVRRLHSRICLIDLAGSERATQTQNVGAALKDGAKINQSLLALANCIDALILRCPGRDGAQTPRRKAPFRDSKLTLLLKSSLTSDCLVSMIANVHPGRDHFEDSNNTLEYAKRASVVKGPSPAAVRPDGRERARAASLPTSSRPASVSPSSSPERPLRSSSRHEGPALPRLPRGAPHHQPQHLAAADPRHHHPAEQSKAVAAAELRGRGLPSRGAAAHPRGHHAARSTSAALVARSCPAAPGFAAALLGSSQHARHPRSPERTPACSESPPTQSSSIGDSTGGTAGLGPHRGRFIAAQEDETSDCGERGASPFFSPPRTPSPLDICHASARSRGSPVGRLRLGAAEEVSTVGAAGLLCTPPGRSLTPAAAPASPSRPASGAARERSKRCVASPVLVRRVSMPSLMPERGCALLGDTWPPFALRALQGKGAAASQHTPSTELLLRVVSSLQAEKLALDAKLASVRSDRARLEGENARLRAANLEKDRQMAMLLASFQRETLARAGANSPRRKGLPPPFVSARAG